jgi:hypothetical protein
MTSLPHTDPTSRKQLTKLAVAFGPFSAVVAVIADCHAVAHARSLGPADMSVRVHCLNCAEYIYS